MQAISLIPSIHQDVSILLFSSTMPSKTFFPKLNIGLNCMTTRCVFSCSSSPWERSQFLSGPVWFLLQVILLLSKPTIWRWLAFIYFHCLAFNLYIISSVCFTCSYRECMLQVPSLKSCHIMGPRKCVFSVVAPALWNDPLPDIRQVPIFLAFRKPLRSGSLFRH